MYNYIKGRITETGDNLVVVETGGVGYEINASAQAISELSRSDSEVKVYTYLSVREDDMSLFGFSSKREKSMFLQLISISGVGPKLAITILSGMNVEQLATAIVRADVKALSAIKGVGKKTAERIALELKDKVSKDYEVTADFVPVVQVEAKSAPNEDAVLALMTLGYTRQEAEAAVSKVDATGLTLEQLIFSAIKNA